MTLVETNWCFLTVTACLPCFPSSSVFDGLQNFSQIWYDKLFLKLNIVGNSIYSVGYCKARWLCNPQKVPKYPESAIIRHFFELGSLHLLSFGRFCGSHDIPVMFHWGLGLNLMFTHWWGCLEVWWEELLGGCLVGEQGAFSMKRVKHRSWIHKNVSVEEEGWKWGRQWWEQPAFSHWSLSSSQATWTKE